MSERPTADDATRLPIPALRREVVYDRFEAAWKSGQRPRIEDYCDGPADPGRPALLRELIIVELAYRLGLGERPTVDEYRARFPAHPGAIRGAFEAIPTPPTSARRPSPTAQPADADRNLLFGVLALQMDFVSREALIAAVSAWVLDKSRPLDRILVDQGALAPDERALLEPLIHKHLERHGGDPARSLSTVGPLGAAREALERVGDPDLQASLTRIAVPEGLDAALPFIEPASLGTPTSSGLRFRVLRPLARGGLGEVFVARDEELRREVALKAIQGRYAGDPDSRARFELEAEVTGRLEHPGIVPVYGLGHHDDGRPFYAMRLIRGESLREAIARFHQAEAPGRDPGERTMALRDLLGRFVAACNAVAYAHSRGILHRDLKPANVMLGAYGETLVVDWGLAKVVGRPDDVGRTDDATLRPESAGEGDATLPGTPLGTPSYMSPEQAAGRLDLLGAASDVYSLGATLYSLLTGRAPFESPDVFATLQGVRRGDFPPPRSINRRVPPALDAICRKAMGLRPEDRYPTPRALADDVEHWLADEAVAAYREPAGPRLARWGRHHRPAVAGMASLAVTVAAALAVGTILIGREAARKEEQRGLAESNFTLARDAVDRMLTEVAEVELADVPQMEPVRRRLLEKARRFYQGFLDRGRADPAVRREAGRAHLRLGEIDEGLGDHVEAERAFRRGIALLEALARDDPGRGDAPRDLARGRDDLGVLLKKANRFRESEVVLRESLRLRERLARDHPDDRDDRQALADGRYHLATLMARLRGRHPEEEDAYREAVRIQEALIADARDRPELRRKLARYLNNLALLLGATGRSREAEDRYREAIAILEGFASRKPATPGDRWQLARSGANLAMLLRSGGRSDEAEALSLRAETLLEALHADFPDLPDYRHELASVLNNVGLLRKESGRARDAERAFREALGLREGLAADFPHVPDYRQALAVTRLNLASVLERADARDAAQAYRDALALQERLSAEFPEVPEYQAALGRTLYSLARLQIVEGDPASARGLLARAIGYHRAVLGADDRDRAGREFLRDDYAVLCMALIASGAHAEAADAAEELPRALPDDPRESLRAAAFLAGCVTAASADPALDATTREARAESYARRALGLLRRASEGRLLDDPEALRRKEFAPFERRDDFRQLRDELRARAKVREG